MVISSGGGGLGGLQQGGVAPGQTFMLETASLKSEPEDLSFSVAREGEAGIRHSIDLEAGAQAIQASAATAVQNVLRSLKESDKSLLNQILPQHLVEPQASQAGLLAEDPARPDSGIGDPGTPEPGPATPARRSRSQADTSPRVHIAKQYTPFGFHVTLEAPTAQWVRKDEDRCTYMNKGQFYGVTLEYRPNPAEPFPGDLTTVKSVVMLVFRDAKNPEDEVNAWEFWHQV